MRVFAGCRDIDASDLPAAAFDQRLDIARDLLDVRLVHTVITYENIQLIEIRFFSKLDQGGEIDVAVNDVLHARLRLAHVVHAAADEQQLLLAVCSLYLNLVAYIRSHHLECITLDQNLASCRWPGTRFRFEFADANVAVVLNDEERQVAPLDRASFDLSGHGPSGFCVTRSEEHTSELQSPCNLVCRLLL